MSNEGNDLLVFVVSENRRGGEKFCDKLKGALCDELKVYFRLRGERV